MSQTVPLEPYPAHLLRPAKNARTSPPRQAPQETTRKPGRSEKGFGVVQDPGAVGAL